MQIKIYSMGGVKEIIQSDPHSAVVEVIMPDNRTVQLVVRENGEIQLRGWGNIPLKLGNATQMRMDCVLTPEAIK